jgi:hypothetical protein
VLVFQRVILLAGFSLLAFACGEEFTGVDEPTAGSGGSPDGGTASGADAGGEGATGGVVEAGGAKPVAGGGAISGGRGGTTAVAGSGGSAGNGGSVIVQDPPIPTEGLELWFDANVGVTQAGELVAGWKDNSGHARNALQTAANYRPRLDMTALNGMPALVFDGTDDYLKVPSLPGDFSHGVSIFAAMQQATDPGICTGFFEASNGPELDDVHLGVWESAMLYEVADSYFKAADYPLVLGKPEVLAAVHQTTGALQIRRDSNALGESTFALPVVVPREQVLIGSTAYAECTPLNGNIGELVVYSRAVSDAELIEIETYLQKKWGCCAD